MKLPFKPIAILVMISLLGIFGYQIYWLTKLYHTMKDDMENNITEAMRISDYNEMMLRVERLKKSDKDHGEVSVSAGYDDNGKSFVHSSTSVTTANKTGISNQKINISYTSQASLDSLYLKRINDSTVIKTSVRRDTLIDHKTNAALRVNEGLDMLLSSQQNIMALASYFQRGLHAGLDIILGPQVAVYDSLLTEQLTKKGINLPHRLQYLHSGSTVDSSYIYTDTMAVVKTPGYISGKRDRNYDYVFDLNTHYTYRLTIGSTTPLVLKQMSGILLTSLIILLILSFSFWFLIHTILKQKTLEEMKTDFTNNITHELKTPIAVAYAANDALLNFNQAENKTQRDKYLRIGQEQLQRLSGLVEQILLMSMERRKMFHLHPETVCMKEMLTPLIELHKLKAGKPVTFDVNIEPESLNLFVDRTHFSNILSNLIDNAIKYSKEKAEVNIYCRRTSDTEIIVSVSDSGIGIATDKIPHVFDKFYRVPNGNIHNTQGYGLGLFYVKTMIEKHGGSVTVNSEPGHGSTFTLKVPVG